MRVVRGDQGWQTSGEHLGVVLDEMLLPLHDSARVPCSCRFIVAICISLHPNRVGGHALDRSRIAFVLSFCLDVLFYRFGRGSSHSWLTHNLGPACSSPRRQRGLKPGASCRLPGSTRHPSGYAARSLDAEGQEDHESRQSPVLGNVRDRFDFL